MRNVEHISDRLSNIYLLKHRFSWEDAYIESSCVVAASKALHLAPDWVSVYQGLSLRGLLLLAKLMHRKNCLECADDRDRVYALLTSTTGLNILSLPSI